MADEPTLRSGPAGAAEPLLRRAPADDEEAPGADRAEVLNAACPRTRARAGGARP